ncbi:MAG: tetratricopeptide repeat protein [Bacteroidia bacterium]|nr:tetratricopeptide repeat protein [Bacteroidia bacterium]
MADKKYYGEESGEIMIAKAKDFWSRYNKPLMIISTVIILLIGGYYIYKEFFKAPKEAKAVDSMFKAEEYYKMDSVNLALNGDGQNPGFLRIISNYGGTEAGNLANFYAGSCYIKLGDNEKAVKYLKKFSTGSKLVQARAYKLLADAYADLGKNEDALDYYKKAAHHFEKDETNSSEYLFLAAYFADRVLKNQKEAISLYKELKEKYPNTQQGTQAEGYLAQLGVYSTEE